MKYLFYLLSLIIIFGLNVGIFEALHLYLLVPSFIFILVLSFALDRESYDFFFWALAAGLWLDFYSADYVGTYAVAFLLTAYLVHLVVVEVVVVEIGWKYLTFITAGSLALMYLIIWAFSAAAYRAGLAQAFMVFHPTWRGFVAELAVDLILLYPLFLFSEWLKLKIEQISVRHSRVG